MFHYLDPTIWQRHLILSLGNLTRALLSSGEVRARVVVLDSVGERVGPSLKQVKNGRQELVTSTDPNVVARSYVNISCAAKITTLLVLVV